MTRIKVEILVWNAYNVAHIQKHSITREEVEAAVLKSQYHKKAYNKRYMLVGRSGKRILSVVVSRQSSKEYFVVTARDANKKERRRIYEREEKISNTKV